MSKVIKGNARKSVLVSEIKKNIEKYNNKLCVYNVDGMTANATNELKKKLPQGVKMLTVPTKLGLYVLKDTMDISDIKNIKGKICFVFSDGDALDGVGLSSMLPKNIRSELELKAVYHNGKLDEKIVKCLIDNNINSYADLERGALFQIFKPIIMLKNFPQIISDML